MGIEDKDGYRVSEYTKRRRGASKGAGWGIRIVEGDGSSWLNSLSFGDIMVYDAKEDAEADAVDCRKQAEVIGEFSPPYRARKYVVEHVKEGAWSPSQMDRTIVDLLEFVEPLAERGNVRALHAVNAARTLLSPYAPARRSSTAVPARLDEDRMAKPKTEIVGVFPPGKKNFFHNAERLIARPTAPAPDTFLTREVKPAVDLASAVAAFKLAMQAGDDDSALGHAMQMLPFVDSEALQRLLQAARALDVADRKEGPGSDEAHVEAECAIWEAAIAWSRSLP